jgi:hypothetical protein
VLLAAVINNLETSLQGGKADRFCNGPKEIKIVGRGTMKLATIPVPEEVLGEFASIFEFLGGEDSHKTLHEVGQVREMLRDQRYVVLASEAVDEESPFFSLWRTTAEMAAEVMLPDIVREAQDKIMSQSNFIFGELQNRRRRLQEEAELAATAAREEEEEGESDDDDSNDGDWDNDDEVNDSGSDGTGDTDDLVDEAAQSDDIPEGDAADEPPAVVEEVQVEPAPADVDDATEAPEAIDLTEAVEMSSEPEPSAEPADTAPVAVINEAPADAEVATDADKPADEPASSGENDGVEDEPPVATGDPE